MYVLLQEICLYVLSRQLLLCSFFRVLILRFVVSIFTDPQLQGILYIPDVGNGSVRSFVLLGHFSILLVGLYIVSMLCFRRSLPMRFVVFLIYGKTTVPFAVDSSLVFL